MVAYALEQYLLLNEQTIDAAAHSVQVSRLVGGQETVTFRLGIEMQSHNEDPLVVAAALIRLGERVAQATIDHREREVMAENVSVA